MFNSVEKINTWIKNRKNEIIKSTKKSSLISTSVLSLNLLALYFFVPFARTQNNEMFTHLTVPIFALIWMAISAFGFTAFLVFTTKFIQLKINDKYLETSDLGLDNYYDKKFYTDENIQNLLKFIITLKLFFKNADIEYIKELEKSLVYNKTSLSLNKFESYSLDIQKQINNNVNIINNMLSYNLKNYILLINTVEKQTHFDKLLNAFDKETYIQKLKEIKIHERNEEKQIQQQLELTNHNEIQKIENLYSLAQEKKTQHSKTLSL